MSGNRLNAEPEGFVTFPTAQMARVLGIHPKTLARLARENRVPHLRVGRVLRFVPSQVLAALQQAGAEGRERA